LKIYQDDKENQGKMNMIIDQLKSDSDIDVVDVLLYLDIRLSNMQLKK